MSLSRDKLSSFTTRPLKIFCDAGRGKKCNLQACNQRASYWLIASLQDKKLALVSCHGAQRFISSKISYFYQQSAVAKYPQRRMTVRLMDPHFHPTKSVPSNSLFSSYWEIRSRWCSLVGIHLFLHTNGLNRQIFKQLTNYFCPSDPISDLNFKVFKSLKLCCLDTLESLNLIRFISQKFTYFKIGLTKNQLLKYSILKPMMKKFDCVGRTNWF